MIDARREEQKPSTHRIRTSGILLSRRLYCRPVVCALNIEARHTEDFALTPRIVYLFF